MNVKSEARTLIALRNRCPDDSHSDTTRVNSMPICDTGLTAE